VLKLEEHGIRDRNLWRLQALVAERLAAMQRGAPVPTPATTAGR
jgi:hypothetical protein